MTFCDCAVCESPIQSPADATLLRDGTPGETDPGSVAYRHTDCDPADYTPPTQTNIF